MRLAFHRRTWPERTLVGVLCATLTSFATPTLARTPGDEDQVHRQKTETPIKHAIVLIGENRTFDHLFATYVSPSGDFVRNLLSEHIINADGTPGKRFD
jgi:phospholipase C